MKMKWILASLFGLAALGVCFALMYVAPASADSQYEVTTISSPVDEQEFYFSDPIDVMGERSYCDFSETGFDVSCSLLLRCPRVSPPDDEFCLETWTDSLAPYMYQVMVERTCYAPDGEGPFDEGDFCLVLTIDGLSDCVSVCVVRDPATCPPCCPPCCCPPCCCPPPMCCCPPLCCPPPCCCPPPMCCF